MNEVKSDVINVCNSLPQPVWRTEAIRQMEQQIVVSQQITMYQLMERAGAALFSVLKQCWPDAHRIWVLCGKGNNGGDGYVLARLARKSGLQVYLAAMDKPSPGITADQACLDWMACGGQVLSMQQLSGLPVTERPDVIVDALLGIGPSTPLHGELPAWIQFINRQQVPVLSADIPSGLNAETGAPLGAAVHASATLTMLALKPGLLTGQAADYVGTLWLAPLNPSKISSDKSAPDKNDSSITSLSDRASKIQLHPVHDQDHQTDHQGKPQGIKSSDSPKNSLEALNFWGISRVLKPRARTAHKGNQGKALLIAGGPGMPGAAHLAASAALRTGSGLVKVHCAPENRAMIFQGRPELMFVLHPQEDLSWSSVLAIGPGLGTDVWGQEQWALIRHYPHPMVVDADALNLLAVQPLRSEHWILTPHPGEAARLLRCTVAQIESDRMAAVLQLQRQYGGVVVLKGPGTLVSDGHHIKICMTGNPGMASGGMGDVLTGTILGLLAQGFPLFQAACLGVLLHGQAADCVAEKSGERGMLASDLLNYLQKLMNPQNMKV